MDFLPNIYIVRLSDFADTESLKNIALQFDEEYVEILKNNKGNNLLIRTRLSQDILERLNDIKRVLFYLDGAYYTKIDDNALLFFMENLD